MTQEQRIENVTISQHGATTRFARGGFDGTKLLTYVHRTAVAVAVLSGVTPFLFDRAPAATMVSLAAILLAVLGTVRLVEVSKQRSGIRTLRNELVVRRREPSDGGYRGAPAPTLEVDGSSMPLDEARGVHIAHTATVMQSGQVIHHYLVYVVCERTAIEVGGSRDPQLAADLAASLSESIGLSNDDVTLSDAGATIGMGTAFGLAFVICVQVIGFILVISELTDFGANTIALAITAPAAALVNVAIDRLLAHTFGAALGAEMRDRLVPALSER